MKTLIVGDIHGDWSSLNSLILKKKPDYILQCGDFGWWPILENKNEKKWKLKGVKPYNTEVFWCDGNHEDHSVLIQNGKIQEFYENINFCSRGSTLTLPDGRIVLFVGGADSIDKKSRITNYDWFPQENITNNDLDLIMKHDKIDIVISHTCPVSFKIDNIYGKINDVNRIALQYVLEKYKPQLWYFGHWHIFKMGKFKNTKWFCLDYPKNGTRWWIWL